MTRTIFVTNHFKSTFKVDYCTSSFVFFTFPNRYSNFLFILSIPPLWLSSQTEGLNGSWCSWSEQYVWNNYIHSCWDHTQARVEKTVWKWALFVHMLYLLFEASVVRRVYTGQKIRKTIIGLLQMFLRRLIYGWKLQKPACFFAFIVKINQIEKSRGAFTEKNKTISQTVRKL